MVTVDFTKNNEKGLPTPGLRLIALMNLSTTTDLEVWILTEIIHVCQLLTNIHGLVANILLL